MSETKLFAKIINITAGIMLGFLAATAVAHAEPAQGVVLETGVLVEFCRLPGDGFKSAYGVLNAPTTLTNADGERTVYPAGTKLVGRCSESSQIIWKRFIDPTGRGGPINLVSDYAGIESLTPGSMLPVK